ncbi:UNVERIFIED_CONTAM: Transcription factor DIVARICATA [Sesamum radiatum]|uniref:Transcription factor DIVARICATA n=1 Tax=Sesamum radiatum TaxID=300843 RepID=A0AAW2V515_SESRA
MDKEEWTSEENKLFENALAEIDPSSPAFFEHVASRVPWKSIQEVRNHYQALVEDVEMIESGHFPLPNYQNLDDHEKQEEMEAKKEDGSPSIEAKTRNGQQRRRGVPWTEEEHQLFLMGLNKYGKGDWRSISRYYVITKTPTQVASHAQKYFRRQTSSTPVDRRRPSIHDIQTVNPTSFASVPQRHAANGTLPNVDEPVPFSPCSFIPMLNHNFNGGAINIEQNPMFLPPMMNSTSFPSAGPIFNQTSAAYPASYMLPSFRNQQWG